MELYISFQMTIGRTLIDRGLTQRNRKLKTISSYSAVLIEAYLETSIFDDHKWTGLFFTDHNWFSVLFDMIHRFVDRDWHVLFSYSRSNDLLAVIHILLHSFDGSLESGKLLKSSRNNFFGRYTTRPTVHKHSTACSN